MNIVQNTEQKTEKETQTILLLLVLSSLQRNSKIVTITNSKLNVLVCLGHILSSG